MNKESCKTPSNLCSSVKSRRNFVWLDHKIVYSPHRWVLDEDSMKSKDVDIVREKLNRISETTAKDIDSDVDSSIRSSNTSQGRQNRKKIIMNEKEMNVLKTPKLLSIGKSIWDVQR